MASGSAEPCVMEFWCQSRCLCKVQIPGLPTSSLKQLFAIEGHIVKVSITELNKDEEQSFHKIKLCINESC